jgi:2'-5' RNA ligase
MAEGSAGGYREGETGLIVKVPAAEPIVGGWRSQFDSAAAAGVLAHITVLYPFLGRDRVDASVLAELDALLAKHQAFDLQLTQCRRFPGVLYLAPEPETELRALTAAIASRWPEAPPYGGQFADVVPHLTIAHSQEPEVFDVIESDVCGRLPVTERIASVQLIIYTGDHWQQAQSFLLAGDERASC